MKHYDDLNKGTIKGYGWSRKKMVFEKGDFEISHYMSQPKNYYLCFKGEEIGAFKDMDDAMAFTKSVEGFESPGLIKDIFENQKQLKKGLGKRGVFFNPKTLDLETGVFIKIE